MDNRPEIIKVVHQVEPNLTSYGINKRLKYEEDPIKEIELKLVFEWLDEQKVRKTINRNKTSYEMKHYVERWATEKYGEHHYISSGSVIAAVIYKNIPYSRVKGGPEIFAAIKVLKKTKK